MLVVSVTKDGVKTNTATMNYEALTFEKSAAVKIIARGGIIIAEKESGDDNLTVHEGN